MKLKEKIKLYLPAILWAGVIFFFSSQAINRPAPFSWLDFIFKKTCHVIEYAIFFWLVYRANKSFKLSLLLAVVFALSDEWHQTFIPGREGTLRDVGFDTIGSLLSLTWIKRSL
ncbi:MAG: VanZ family protein [Candidatus Beckwithbacteria bacterium]